MVTIDRSRDALLTPFAQYTLKDRYMLPGDESPQDLFARVAGAFADNEDHAQRLYDYISKLWFMPATPVLSNGGTTRGLPISCFLNECQDDLESINNLWSENVWLAARGGGIGSYWGNVRSIGEKVGGVGKTSGIIPFIKVMDSKTLAISQGSLRRGSAAVYLPIDHPEIEEFIEIRRPTGGDPNRRCLNLHHGVVIPDDFMKAVEANSDWELKSPATRETIRTVKARDLWARLLTARIETGEPYLLFIDKVNEAIPEWHKRDGLFVKTSNLCSEITLPTSETRTAVCCLSSLNVETFQEWQSDELFLEDVMRFLDNVLQSFIDKAPPTFVRAVTAAVNERSVGLGVMGFHGYLQSMGVAIEGAMAKVWNKNIFSHIHRGVTAADEKLAAERGACPDAERHGFKSRFSNKTAIAPTASISIIAGASPSIEPMAANVYNHKTLSGTFMVRNKHLAETLENHGKNTKSTWADIAKHEGSVQHLEFLTEDEKAVFKTAFEIDQRWLVDLAADRQQYIDQAQSLNLFLPADVHKRTLNSVHLRAWQAGLKSLYYCRSKSIQRAEKSDGAAEAATLLEATKKVVQEADECLACQ